MKGWAVIWAHILLLWGGNGASSDRKKLETALLGKRAQFQCSVNSSDAAEVIIWWQFQGRNLTRQENENHQITVSKSASGAVSSELILTTVSWQDEGIYSCLAKEVNSDDEPTMQQIILEIYAAPKSVRTRNGSGRTGSTTELSCSYEGRPVPTVKWLGFGKEVTEDPLKYEITVEKTSDKKMTSLLKIMSLGHADNGTYLCHGENDYGTDVAVMEAVVFDKPEVKLDLVVPVGRTKLFFNWTTIDWNSPITDYFLSFRASGDTAWVYFIGEKILPGATSFVMRNLTADSTYHIKLAAKNKYGTGEFDLYHSSVKTLTVDPMYVPKASVKGLTWNSISIGWTAPPTDEIEDILNYITYYRLVRKTAAQEFVMYQPVGTYPFYLWRDLKPATDYTFTVAACNGFTTECGTASEPVHGTTEDGLSGEPSTVVATCKFDNISGMNYVDVSWSDPSKPNGQIEFYNIQLHGISTYLDSSGSMAVDRFGPQLKTEDISDRDGLQLTTRFDFLPANTNYTASVCAVTRRKECGVAAQASCKMRSTPPRVDQLGRGFQWLNDRRVSRDIFRLRTSRLSERNGPICCLRIIVVRMKPGQGVLELPQDQADLPMRSYKKVHSDDEDPTMPNWGAYIAEIVGPNFLGRDVLVGDGQNILSAHVGSNCPACQTGVRAQLLRQAQQREAFQSLHRERRTVGAPTELVEDGFLDPDSNYTAFVEVVVPESAGTNRNVVGRSPYMTPRKPGQSVYTPGSSGGSSGSVPAALVSVLGILAGLVTVALCLLLALFMLRRYSKVNRSTSGSDTVDGDIQQDMDLRKSLRHFCNTIFRNSRDSQYLITPGNEIGNVSKGGVPKKPAEMPPIAKGDLVAAYLERHRDSDYGFQAEFELLPSGFPDRTTEVCDRQVNRTKNRYPDIKCYDQTRVKLKSSQDCNKAPINDDQSDSTSEQSTAADKPVAVENDYINANFVPGHKNRKLWVCAQGPLEHTVQDFWRMVYEQNVEMIIMLTNLEEYNRTKCAQYWPAAGDSAYTPLPNLMLNVRFCTEQRYSDYIVRELTLTATRASTTTAANGSSLDVKTTETRTVKHFHYLQWKDFNAPEHAPGMLRFVKRVNEEHDRCKKDKSSSTQAPKANGTGGIKPDEPSTSSECEGPPILIHCSAGVGRSGTLIAIDGLIQQLREEDKVTIYKMVCDLRHSRNYLVQSVKQYMFVYRAIMEMAQFGDTEIEASEIKPTWTTLAENAGKKLELEFARLANMVDDRKALSVGTNDENRSKNQSDTVIPFDRNRVILTPDGQRPHSTYINASFIEGYHNDESFIITQDPMPSTVEDFWRMVTEHNICTMVQLNAPPPVNTSPTSSYIYWSETDLPGSVADFGSLKVTLNVKDPMPSYIKREFTVYNSKVEEEVNLTHFAYSGWGDAPQRPPSPNPGQGSPEVPKSTHGLLDLVEHALAHKVEASLPGPIAVHCRFGSERSSVFVSLCCLVQQLKTESRADVFTTVRKLRSQRQGMVQHLSQYKFIYRAISDYVDLYRNKDDEYAYSVPVNSVNQTNGKL